LPPSLKQGYKAALADPEYTSLRDALALQDGLVVEVLREMAEASQPPWGEALRLLKDVLHLPCREDARAGLDELRVLLERGADAAKTQARCRVRLRELIQEKTRTAAAEWKRLHALQGLVTVEQALGFARAFVDAAQEVIEDKELLKRLQLRTTALLPPPRE
jgi:hypothetical protein